MRFREWFAPTEETAGEEHLDQARIVVEFANGRYWPRFRGWLDEELGRPVKIGDHVGMIDAAVRRNTLLEVREKIEREIKASLEILERERI